MEHKIEFKSINADGQTREWSMTKQELYDEYFQGECDLPSLDDVVFDCYVSSTYDNTEIFCTTFKQLMETVIGFC